MDVSILPDSLKQALKAIAATTSNASDASTIEKGVYLKACDESNTLTLSTKNRIGAAAVVVSEHVRVYRNFEIAVSYVALAAQAGQYQASDRARLDLDTVQVKDKGLSLRLRDNTGSFTVRLYPIRDYAPFLFTGEGVHTITECDGSNLARAITEMRRHKVSTKGRRNTGTWIADGIIAANSHGVFWRQMDLLETFEASQFYGLPKKAWSLLQKADGLTRIAHHDNQLIVSGQHGFITAIQGSYPVTARPSPRVPVAAVATLPALRGGWQPWVKKSEKLNLTLTEDGVRFWTPYQAFYVSGVTWEGSPTPYMFDIKTDGVKAFRGKVQVTIYQDGSVLLTDNPPKTSVRNYAVLAV